MQLETVDDSTAAEYYTTRTLFDHYCMLCRMKADGSSLLTATTERLYTHTLPAHSLITCHAPSPPSSYSEVTAPTGQARDFPRNCIPGDGLIHCTT